MVERQQFREVKSGNGASRSAGVLTGEAKDTPKQRRIPTTAVARRCVGGRIVEVRPVGLCAGSQRKEGEQ